MRHLQEIGNRTKTSKHHQEGTCTGTECFRFKGDTDLSRSKHECETVLRRAGKVGFENRNMRKVILSIIVVIFLMAMPASAETQDFFEANEFKKIYTTAYCCGEITANGSKVHYGGCASTKEHMGDLAILYTTDGDYIGTFECNDLGGTDAIRQGYVIDVYFPTMEECQAYMERVAPSQKVYVKYVKGEG